MHPTIGYDLAKAQITGQRHQAQRDALGRTARRARRARSHQAGHHLPALPAFGRRVRTALGARST